MSNRKIERKMLTFKSNQPGLTHHEVTLLGDISTTLQPPLTQGKS
jgi:hypothetical protein